MARDAYRKGEAFCERLASFRQPLYVVAHHDDEVPTAGLIQRLGPRTKFVYVTNSAGVASTSPSSTNRGTTSTSTAASRLPQM